MVIDTQEPYSDGWWLQQLYAKLRKQQKHAADMHERFKGNPPLPPMSPNQVDAVKWFVQKCRTNFERLIVNAVLNRLEIRGIRTSVDADEGGDAEAFTTWKKSRGKLWSSEVAEMALSMGVGFVMVGRNQKGKLLVTAEDPRQCVVITDPADPLCVEAALKLIYDPVKQQDVGYLFLRQYNENEGDTVRMRKATRDRSVSTPVAGWQFDANAFDWVSFDASLPGNQVEDYYPEWLQGSEDREALIPIVPFENQGGMAEFEPHIELLDRISHQILQRMTIATIQAFKQRAMKGLPQNDPDTGEKVDYDKIFIAEPGAIWNLPEAVEIWESGEVNLQSILLSIRDDIKDLCAVSGTPLYSVSPDLAQGSAEGASIQREQLTFKVKRRQVMWELPHELVCELIFRTGSETDKPDVVEKNLRRAESGTQEIMWGPADLPSMSERANAIAQTKGVIPTYYQQIEIWGMTPAEADKAQSMLQEEQVRAAAMAAAQAKPQQPPQNAPQAPQRALQPREQGPSVERVSAVT